MGAKASKILVGFIDPAVYATIEYKTKQAEAKRKKIEAKATATAEEEATAAAEQTRALTPNNAQRGPALSGTLLTGAGGLTDPALTGKQTLLGKR